MEEINISAEDMMEELSRRITQLTMEVAAKNVLIQRLYERLEGEAVDGTASGD